MLLPLQALTYEHMLPDSTSDLPWRQSPHRGDSTRPMGIVGGERLTGLA